MSHLDNINFNVTGTNSDLLGLKNPAIVENESFFKALDFIREVVGNEMVNNLMSGFEILNTNEHIIVKVDDKASLDYSIIDMQKFKYFNAVLKNIMGDKHL